MRESRPKEKFAWRPVRTVSGKWLWLKKCVRVDKYLWGLAGELPLVDKEYYTLNEYLIEQLK